MEYLDAPSIGIIFYYSKEHVFRLNPKIAFTDYPQIIFNRAFS